MAESSAEYKAIRTSLVEIQKHLGANAPKSMVLALLEKKLINDIDGEKIELEKPDSERAHLVVSAILKKVKATPQKIFADFLTFLDGREELHELRKTIIIKYVDCGGDQFKFPLQRKPANKKATQMPSSATEMPTSAATQMPSSATEMPTSAATQMPTSARVVEDSGAGIQKDHTTNAALQSSASIAMESKTVQEGQEDCACDQHTPNQSKAYAMSKDPCHPLKLKECREYLNGEGVKIAIIDQYKKEETKTYHRALQKNDGSLKIRLVDTTNGKAEEIHADKKTNVVISNHALQCTSIAVGEKVDGFFIYEEKLHKYTFPGGVAPKADATLYLVDYSNNDSVLLALKEIIDEVSNGRKKFDVLSMSFGSVRNCYYKREIHKILTTNTIVVVAAANRGNAVLSCTAKLADQFEFCNQSLISVGGLNCYNTKAEYSPRNVTISQICEFLAPSTDDTGRLLKFTGGTSMSTPAVAGVICLLIQIGKQHKINSFRKNEIIRLLKKSIKGEEAESIDNGCYNQEFLQHAFEDGMLFKRTAGIIII